MRDGKYVGTPRHTQSNDSKGGRLRQINAVGVLSLSVGSTAVQGRCNTYLQQQ